MPVDPNLFKQVMRRFATGVMVLTVSSGKEMHAMTMNAVASLSLSPVLMLVCIEKNARSHELVHSVRAFALNILTEEQLELGAKFAYDAGARSQPAEYVKGEIGETGALLIKDSLGFMECKLVGECDGGDHTIFIGQVVNAGVRGNDCGPLVYYDRKFMGLGDKENKA